jgi:hypothetical protein
MARARNLKPGLFRNEVLGVADPFLTLLFEGLWIIADREGRLEDRPLRIKADVFPYREGLDVDTMLAWLAEKDFIVRYVVDGKAFIQITEFVKHQNPHKDEKKSEIPAPNLHGATPEQEQSLNETYPASSLIPDPLNLIPDSLNPQPAARKKSEPINDEKFVEAYSLYPSRPGSSKASALKAWKARIASGADPDAMIAGVKRYAAFVRAAGTEPNFIKMPATFFGPDQHYMSDWTVPAVDRRSVPRAGPGSVASDRFRVADLDHSSSRAAMEESMKRHNITVPDGPIDF